MDEKRLQAQIRISAYLGAFFLAASVGGLIFTFILAFFAAIFSGSLNYVLEPLALNIRAGVLALLIIVIGAFALVTGFAAFLASVYLSMAAVEAKKTGVLK